MRGDLVFLVFAALVPPLWLAIGLVGLVARSRRSGKTFEATLATMLSSLR